MTRHLPLIRAGAIAPVRRWLREQGRDPAGFLRIAGLDWAPEDDPAAPIPLRGAFDLLREVARAEGPDAPHRIAADRAGLEIGLIGAAGFAGPDLRAGLHRIARRMPMHCSHEVFVVEDRPGALHVRDGWMVAQRDDESLHYVQQYVAAIVETICAHVPEAPRPLIRRVGMVPHPEFGLTHLRGWLGDRVAAVEGRMLEIEIPDAVADLAIAPVDPSSFEDAPSSPLADLGRIQTLAEGVAALVASILPRAMPTIAAVAHAADVSPRTLRRQLREEGLTFTDILDDTRARIALARLREDDPPSLSGLARDLGYAHPAALTRAVRRWTGRTPSSVLRGEGVDDVRE